MKAGGRGRARQLPWWSPPPARYRGCARQLPQPPRLPARHPLAMRPQPLGISSPLSCPPPPSRRDLPTRFPTSTKEEGVQAGRSSRLGDVGVGRTRVRAANVLLRRSVSVGCRANIQRDRRRGIAPVGRTVRSAGGCWWADVFSGRVAKGAVTRCAVARIRDVAVDIVGAHLRDVVVPLRGAQSGREAKRSVRRRGGIPVSRTVCSARGCLRADVPPGQRANGFFRPMRRRQDPRRRRLRCRYPSPRRRRGCNS